MSLCHIIEAAKLAKTPEARLDQFHELLLLRTLYRFQLMHPTPLLAGKVVLSTFHSAQAGKLCRWDATAVQDWSYFTYSYQFVPVCSTLLQVDVNHLHR